MNKKIMSSSCKVTMIITLRGAQIFSSICDEVTNEIKTITNRIVLEAEFHDLPEDSRSWRGFKGRIFNYDSKDTDETGLSLIYRKTYELGKDVAIEIKSKSRILKQEFEACATPRDFANFLEYQRN